MSYIISYGKTKNTVPAVVVEAKQVPAEVGTLLDVAQRT